MSRRKILFFIPTLGGGGAERVFVNLVNNLDRQKFDITVQTMFKAGVNAQYLRPELKFIEGKVKQFRGNIHVMKLFSPKFLYGFFVHNHYDIVVSYLEGPSARIISGCPDVGTKKICWIHSQEILCGSFRTKQELIKCYNSFDIIECVAQTVKESLLTRFPLSCECGVIYNVIEDQKIRSFAVEEVTEARFSDQLNVVTVGRVVRQKGFERLVRVHKKLINLGIAHHIYHIGGGAVEKLQSYVNEYNVSDTFHLLGFQNNPYKFIVKADLFVCSSIIEGFSTAVSEALILGVPVISTRVSGSVELLGEHNEYGIVTENNEESLFDGLSLLLSDPIVLSHYKKKAAERGLKFSKTKAVESVETLLEEI